MLVKLETPLGEIRGIGPHFLPRLKKLGILTARDLLYHFPSRYEDWSEIVNIAELKSETASSAKATGGQSKTIRARVIKIESRRAWTRRKMLIIEGLLADDSGEIQAVWFNQPYIKNILKPGTLANFAGKISARNSKLILSNPTYELVGKTEAKHTGRLVPIYPETKGLTSKGLRFVIKGVLDHLEEIGDFIPPEILKSEKIPEINKALQNIHFPKTSKSAGDAKNRFAFEELFLLQLRNLREKLAIRRERAHKIAHTNDEIKDILKGLPFELTISQKKALVEILKDLDQNHPMNRLLQGDVGSGKTVVAGIAALIAGKVGQVAIMAPTEILARQHYKTLVKLFGDAHTNIALLIGKEARIHYGKELETASTKSDLIKKIASGEIKIVVGTHALIQKNVKFKNLGLVVIDEQHRFGVSQRAQLTHSTSSGQTMPHFLSMSATPIPRTLMLSIFGDLDLSIIDELPKGRKTILTKVVSPHNRDKAYAFIRGQVRRGRQVFVVCPRITINNQEQVTKNKLELQDIKNVEEEYKKLSKNVFPDLMVQMLHGKLKSEEKKKVMSDFTDGKIDILVTTSVIEVGVDVPNATIMMIEGAERFGLAQLYQFRGRVGRGEHQSFCFLFTEAESKTAEKRLEAIAKAKNGFELAEVDLKIRGPGEFLGQSQTGIPDIAMESLKNPELLGRVRTTALEIIAKDPDLKTHTALLEKLREFKQRVHLE
ncbi:MAG: ATP-dependent DNA helicase RecG [Candidatus Colwellbacteria bacterium]|nr:ATP-dependent DNA helicase RecG [Candidatus Colwellbacteria bacterium]